MRSLNQRPDGMSTALLVEGLAGAVLVGRDGSPVWQLARVAAVVVLTGAAMYGARVLPGPARAVVAWVAGVVGVAVGIGIGAFHLVKSGPWAVTVAGLACLVAGVALLWWGVVGLARVARGWLRVPVGAVAVLVAVLVVFPTAPALYVTNVPRPAVGEATPGDRGLDHREVRFRTPDGVTLSGWYVPSRTGAAVALLHGASSTRSAVLGHAVVLARHGYGVLLYDARGHGRSTGRAMDFGWHGDEDVAGAVSFLQAQPEVDPRRVGAVGMSMGGEQVIGAAAADRRIRAVVAEGATGRTADDDEWLGEEYGLRGSLTQAWMGLFEYGLADLLTSAGPPVSLHDAVAVTAPRPVLLVTASTVPEEGPAARYIRSASPRTVAVWEVPGAGHTGGLATRPREWEARVVGFLDRALAE
jgi:pimeloyl-ACP methyl ester carboxylesterase